MNITVADTRSPPKRPGAERGDVNEVTKDGGIKDAKPTLEATGQIMDSNDINIVGFTISLGRVEQHIIKNILAQRKRMNSRQNPG